MKRRKCPWFNRVEPDQNLARVGGQPDRATPSIRLSLSRPRTLSLPQFLFPPPPSPHESGEVRSSPPPCRGANDAPLGPLPIYPGDSLLLAGCSRARPVSTPRVPVAARHCRAPGPCCSAVAGVELNPVPPWRGEVDVCSPPVVLLHRPHGHCPVAVELRPWARGKVSLPFLLLLPSSGLRPCSVMCSRLC